MLNKSRNYLYWIFALGVITVILLSEPKSVLAASIDLPPGKVISLDSDKVYEYDLDADGSADRIRYKVTVNDDQHKTFLKLYINDKLCLSREDDGFFFHIDLLDLNVDDNYLDLYIHTVIESDCVKNPFFVRYDGNKILNKIDFDLQKLINPLNAFRFSIYKTQGDGSFTLVVDTPVYSEAIGCYYCYIPFQLKDNLITAVSTQTYPLAKSSRVYSYKASKNFIVYKKAGSKNISYKVKKGENVTFDLMFRSKSGNIYFRMINSKGKKGWINSKQENLFTECPGWG